MVFEQLQADEKCRGEKQIKSEDFQVLDSVVRVGGPQPGKGNECGAVKLSL